MWHNGRNLYIYTMSIRDSVPRAELHTHLGGSVAPPILWSIAHAQGIKLPSKDYWEFEEMITMKEGEFNAGLDNMHNNFYHWTELIQSSPLAVEEAVKSVFGGGYRKCNLVLQELRFNPMFRNRGGEQDLDHIIMAALRGMDKAVLEYPQVRAGIILLLDRTLSFEQNAIIVRKAIKYKDRGVVGVDVAGPQRDSFSMEAHVELFEEARAAGLGVTVHTGEEGSVEEMRLVVDKVRPDRIGHGFLCVKDESLLKAVIEQEIVLEACITSNLRNRKVSSMDEMRSILHTYLEHGVKFTLNTDGPEMYCTNISMEQQLAIRENMLTEEQVQACTDTAFAATFIK